MSIISSSFSHSYLSSHTYLVNFDSSTLYVTSCIRSHYLTLIVHQFTRKLWRNWTAGQLHISASKHAQNSIYGDPDTAPPSSSTHTSLWTEIPCYTAFPFNATLDVTLQTAMNKQWRLWNILCPTEEYYMKILTSYRLPASFLRCSSIFNTLTCVAQASTDEAGKWEMDS